MLGHSRQGLLDLEHEPELPWRARDTPTWRLFWGKSVPVKDPFLVELLVSRPVQRLRRIGFLGAIDYLIHGNGQAPHQRRHNRFDHSVNVALLALRYSMLRGLGQDETRLLAAAALLHDVGHGPLSHTLEPIFRKHFQIDHHRSSLAIVQGRSPLGDELPRIFRRHRVSLEGTIALLTGEDKGPHAFLFDSPVNFDTIEAIARCCFFAKTPRPVAPTDFIDAIATRDTFPVDLADRFWTTKEVIYRTVIFSRRGLMADVLSQHFVKRSLQSFRMEDFFLDDVELRRKHPTLFKLLEHVRRHPSASGVESIPLDYDAVIDAGVRHFTVDTAQTVHSSEDLPCRYRQRKENRELSLKLLMGAGVQGRHLQGSLSNDGRTEGPD